MKIRSFLQTLIALVILQSSVSAADGFQCFELRTYTANEGKLDALHSRFSDHTIEIFERHGMTNIGYWAPQENDQNQLVYLLAYPTREARDKSWKGFFGDPAWTAAYKASIADGRLVKKVDSVFLKSTDFSPEIKASKSASNRTFELRTYTATPDHLPNLNARFRDHTVELFKKHGITNFAYFNLMEGQDGAENTLVYLLAHQSKAAAKASFDSFRQDTKWKAARKDSEEKAGGSLTTRGGVKSVFMNPTDYSQTK
jgi:hypothetical protein